jgi:hypothetical protein
MAPSVITVTLLHLVSCLEIELWLASWHGLSELTMFQAQDERVDIAANAFERHCYGIPPVSAAHASF